MSTPQNITILGGGIMGLTCAYVLSERGHSISIHDPKGFPANNASLMAGGMLAPYSEIEHMNNDWIDAGHHGIKFWQALKLDIGFRTKRQPPHRPPRRSIHSGAF